MISQPSMLEMASYLVRLPEVIYIWVDQQRVVLKYGFQTLLISGNLTKYEAISSIDGREIIEKSKFQFSRNTQIWHSGHLGAIRIDFWVAKNGVKSAFEHNRCWSTQI